MSNKVQTFTSFIAQPLNTYNFIVQIPETNYSVLVESAVFPSQKLQEIVLWHQGEAVKFPTLPSQTSPWQVTLPEADNGSVRADFEAMFGRTYDQKLGHIHHRVWQNIIVSARDMEDNVIFSSILHGAWLAGRNDVSLNNSSVTEAWKWVYDFRYQWIEDVKK